MIKVNLAKRKQSASVEGSPKGAGAFGGKFSFSSVDFSRVNEFPIRKFVLPIIVALVANYVVQSTEDKEIDDLAQSLEKQNSEIARLQTNLSKLKSYESLKKSLDEDGETIKTKLSTVQKLILDRAVPQRVFVSIVNALPSDVWLTELNFKKAKLELKGGAVGFNQISDFLKNLTESAYFKDVELKSSQQSKEAAGVEIANFEIEAKRR